MNKLLQYISIILVLNITSCAIASSEQNQNIQNFVKGFYVNILKRQADILGLNYWTNKLISHELTASDIARGFIFSNEYSINNKSDTQYLNDLYGAFFNRTADTQGFNYWMHAMHTGTSRSEVLDAFLHSDEFKNLAHNYSIQAYRGDIYSNQNLEIFITGFYQAILGRTPNQIEIDYWTHKLSTGEHTGKDIAYGFIYSKEYNQASKSNREFILTLYKAFFQREPSTEEVDYWLIRFGDGMERSTLFNAFIHSEEFINLTSGYGILAYRGAPILTTPQNNQNVEDTNNTTVSTPDIVPPVITLNGENPLYIKKNALFNDPGATANDDRDGNISVTIIEDNVSIENEGNYTIRYKAVDSAGNENIQDRTVIVQYKPFIIQIKTDNNGTSASNAFEIPINTSYSNYDYSIDCDSDGIEEATNISTTYTCTYAQPGTYQLSIQGTFPAIKFYQGSNQTDAKKLLKINQWGSIIWQSMDSAFYKCNNLLITAADAPILYQVNSMRNMFAYASTLNANLNHWDVSTIKDMSFIFRDASSFNGDISHWDTQNVTNMSYMFYRDFSFNQPLTNWDVSNVQYMNNMFNSAHLFNQPLARWNTSNVLDMSGMFNGAYRFNQDISGWNIGHVTTTAYMLANAQSFDQDITGWNTQRVTSMRGMFQSTYLFNNDISGWNTSRVTDMSYMFYYAKSFDQDISIWDTSRVTDMSYMFSNANSFDQDISNWNTSLVSNMKYMFYNAVSFDQNLAAWNTINVTNMDRMFYHANAFLEDLSGWDVTNVTTHFEFSKISPLDSTPQYIPTFP